MIGEGRPPRTPPSTAAARRTPLIGDDGAPLMQPLTPGAQAAIRAVIAGTRDQLDEALAPYGLTAADVALPTFQRITFAEEYLLDAPGADEAAETPGPALFDLDAENGRQTGAYDAPP